MDKVPSIIEEILEYSADDEVKDCATFSSSHRHLMQRYAMATDFSLHQRHFSYLSDLLKSKDLRNDFGKSDQKENFHT